MSPTAGTGRRSLTRARRIIVKIGSHALAEDEHLIERVAADVAALRAQGRAVVVVSSGAVALGWKRLGYRRRPKEVNRLQASASAGQSVLMSRYSEAFDAHGLTAAQVLLTHSDLSKRGSLNNARSALGALLDAGAVPIVNENDAVATEEIRFGDNDQLAAMVTPLVGADLLVMLTNADGVLDDGGRRISVLAPGVDVVDHRGGGAHGSGGIASKVAAARKACRAGAHAVVAHSTEPDVLSRVVAGEDVGTLFEPVGNALRARKHWIAYTLRPRGTVVVDEGAVRALRSGKKSLLPIGVLGVRGKFDPGEAVSVVGPDGVEVARGLSRISALETARAAGACRDATGNVEAEALPSVVVHKDDLVLVE